MSASPAISQPHGALARVEECEQRFRQPGTDDRAASGSTSHALQLALAIGTLVVAEDRSHTWGGRGIVWDSESADEVERSRMTAEPFLARLGSSAPATVSR